jgi:DNA primase
MKKQFLFERECIHRDDGSEGDFYNGMIFIKALQRLQSNDAVKMAGKIAPFYWVDAPRVLIWLCRECATELHVSDAPRAVIHSARR